MGSAFDDWVHAHAHGVLLAIEVLWVSGFLAVFVVYFAIKHWIKKKKQEGAKPTEPLE